MDIRTSIIITLSCNVIYRFPYYYYIKKLRPIATLLQGYTFSWNNNF